LTSATTTRRAVTERGLHDDDEGCGTGRDCDDDEEG
jgi:hypothetical protein